MLLYIYIYTHTHTCRSHLNPVENPLPLELPGLASRIGGEIFAHSAGSPGVALTHDVASPMIYF